jgi:hypothetical protein
MQKYNKKSKKHIIYDENKNMQSQKSRISPKNCNFEE